MRVLHIVASLGNGSGIAEAVLRLANASSAETTLAAVARKDEALACDVERDDARVVLFDKSLPGIVCFSLDMLLRLPALVRAADLVHVHGAWTFPVWWGCRLALRHGRPLVRSPHGSFVRGALRKSSLFKRVAASLAERPAVERAQCLVATSQAEREDLRLFAPGAPEAVVIPNGIWTPERVGAPAAARSGQRTVLCLSRLHPLKGLENLIDAWALAAPGSGWRLRIVGPGSPAYRAALRGRADRAGCGTSVHVEEAVYGEEKWVRLRSADLAAQPSLSECFGLAVGEALACGVPAIATKGAPWSELLGRAAHEADWQDSRSIERDGMAANGRCGWWMDIGVEPLAAALREAMALSDDERRALGENGRRLVESKYRWQDVAAQMDRVYESALRKGV
jgi:glycosyltransferase involved in cell wall biosynthesis